MDLSRDGRYLVFSTTSLNLVANDPQTAFNISDIFVYDRETNVIARVTAGASLSDASSRGTISRDGRFIAFRSGDDSLVDDDNNNLNDYFVTTNPLYEPPTSESIDVPATSLALALLLASGLITLSIVQARSRS